MKKVLSPRTKARRRAKTIKNFYLNIGGSRTTRAAIISDTKAEAALAFDALSGRKVTHRINVAVDIPGIALRLAERAVTSKGGKATMGNGLVRVTAR